MKYYIIAGEASGDLHASNLIKQLNLMDMQADIRAWGGDLMQTQGASIAKHYRDLAFMGFLEVLMNLKTILGNISFCKKDILAFHPDIIVLVDYPGFNLRIAEWANKQGFKVIYYISPQVWAWKKNRVYKIKKYVNKMIVILPFEKDFYAQYDYQVSYVGHPLLDALPQADENADEIRKKLGLDQRPVIALLPGSRKQEVRKMLKIMLTQPKYFPDHQFVIAGAPSLEEAFYKGFIGNKDIKWVGNQTHQLLRLAQAALVTSGTATLETALIGIPEVVCYKGSQISFEIAKRIVNIKFISLVNLIMDKEVVKELIQQELNEKNLKKELGKILSNSGREDMLQAFAELKLKLGDGGASERAAKIVYNFNKFNELV
jgi:lipid-A-disaccharide synthase